MSRSWGVGPKAAAAVAACVPASVAWLQWKYPKLWPDFLYYLKIQSFFKTIVKINDDRMCIIDFFEEHAKKRPHHPCILFEEEMHTYAEVSGNVNRTARWIRGSDPSLKKGDVVCVLLHNGPTIVWTWLGVQKLGVIASMINYNLKGEALVHCIRASEAKKIIFGSEFLGVVMDIKPALDEMGVGLWMTNDTRIPGLMPPKDVVAMEISTVSGAPFPTVPISGLGDISSFIFTSGTTGMPKPAVIPHSKPIGAAEVYHMYTGLSPGDVYYVCMPIYHSAALLISVSGSLYRGATLAIARKFSASHFWDDVRKFRVTIFQYIGEICRYLLAQPKTQVDGQYTVPLRAAIGNGLQPDIWEEFQTRFNIFQIFEFYGATEGNYTFINNDGQHGSVGRYSCFLRRKNDNVEIVDYDYATGEPRRGPDGLCVRLPKGKSGLMLLKISPLQLFSGYRGPKEMTTKKMVHNVKVTGDMYFNSGDLMKIDVDDYVYFIDRLGDTFRWKGENVSTMEVSHVLNDVPEIFEANVYGVHVPGHAGRAGMAAIVVHQGASFDLHAFYQHVTSCLPDFARPKFLRLVEKMDTTGTYKHKKTDLVKRGFAPDGDGEVYVVDSAQETYVPITQEHIRMITSGISRL